MQIAFVLYPGFTAFDLVGPYDVIARWPRADVRFLVATMEAVRTDRGLTVLPTDTPSTLPRPDMIVVPGSETPLPLRRARHPRVQGPIYGSLPDALTDDRQEA